MFIFFEDLIRLLSNLNLTGIIRSKILRFNEDFSEAVEKVEKKYSEKLGYDCF